MLSTTGDIQNGIKEITLDIIDKKTQRWAERMNLYDACRSNDVEFVKRYIECGLDVKEKDAVESAAYRGHYEICKLLIENGAPIDSALKYAEYGYDSHRHHDFQKIIELLISAGVETNNQTLLFAAEKGMIKIVETLLKTGADPYFTEDGKTFMDLLGDKTDLLFRSGE